MPKITRSRADASFATLIAKDDIRTIDHKILTQKFSEAERAMLLARRRQLAGQEKFGARTKSAKAFMTETTRRTRLSKATQYRDLRRVDELGAALLERVIGTPLDRGKVMDAMIRLPAAKREELVRKARDGEEINL